MLNLRAGSAVPFPEQLREAYGHSNGMLIANVGTNKLPDVLEHFISMHSEPLFFFLELPSKLEYEAVTRPNTVREFHVDVYYLDFCTRQTARNVLKAVGDLLLADGLCSFGFGGQDSGDELSIGKYNLVRLWCSDAQRYEGFFEKHGIYEAQPFVSAWDTFTPEHPGESSQIELNGKTVFDIPEYLSDWGMYFAERRAQ